jgi:hypothetical protein
VGWSASTIQSYFISEKIEEMYKHYTRMYMVFMCIIDHGRSPAAQCEIQIAAFQCFAGMGGGQN